MNPSPEIPSIDLREEKDSLTFPIVVQPRASKDEISGIHGQALKIRLSAPPVDGEANAACIQFLSKILGLPRSAIEIIRGTSSRKKLIRVTGIDSETFISRFKL